MTDTENLYAAIAREEAEMLLGLDEFEAPEADPAEADPAEAESVFRTTAMICARCGRPVIWHTIARDYFHDNGWTACDNGALLKMAAASTCPLHGAGCEAWA